LVLEDIREHNTPPEVATIAQDSISKDKDSSFSNSINSIVALEVNKIYIPPEKATKNS
jgi:hypothetical protein